jgi:hypothetical protein
MTLAPRRPTHTFGGEGQENLPLQAGSEHARVQQRVTARSGELVPGQRRDHDPRADLLLLPQPRFSNDAAPDALDRVQPLLDQAGDDTDVAGALRALRRLSDALGILGDRQVGQSTKP